MPLSVVIRAKPSKACRMSEDDDEMKFGHVLNPSDRYLATTGRARMTGIQALTRLPLDVRRRDAQAGLRTAAFISGYEGSPLGGYDIELGRNAHVLGQHDVVFKPGLNEELAATAVQGSQLTSTMQDQRFDGVVGFWYGKSPGLDRATDAIRHANLGGTDPRGGVVAIVGDDPIAKSSSVPGASEGLLADLGLPTLYPASVQEVLDLGIHAIAMSRVCGLWSALKIVTNIADASSLVDLDPARVTIAATSRDSEARDSRSVTAMFAGANLAKLERSRNEERLELARTYIRANKLNRMLGASSGALIGIVAAGKSYLDVEQALESLGVVQADWAAARIRVLKLAAIFPLDPSEISAFAEGLDEILVIEEKRSFLEAAIKDLLYGRPNAPLVFGKTGPSGSFLLPSHGELDPDTVAKAIRPRVIHHGVPLKIPFVPAHTGDRSPLPLAVRTPYFCSGCPHNSSTQVPEGALVGAGIGCHSLTLLMPQSQVGQVTGLTQMGGEGAQWFGMEPFVDRSHMFQNLGDGTFHHSGSLAVRAAVASQTTITYKLLYNSAVAMTGGQPVVGQMSVPEICRAMLAEGIRRIIVTTDNPHSYRRSGLPREVAVWRRERLLEAQEVLAATRGVTMLIHDQECATELRRKRKRGLAPAVPERVMINERVCEGCGDCGRKSNCLSVHPVATEYGRKTRIDQSSCNSDDACVAGDCPAFLKVRPRKAGRASSRSGQLDADGLPTPTLPDLGMMDYYTVRLLGIGGSGVVTTSQILGSAASLSGLFAYTLDQTGLAQKGGAVVSDIKISTEDRARVGKASQGEVDLYVGADIIVAADAANLAATNPLRTVAVTSTAIVPTGSMIADVTRPEPHARPLLAQISANSRTNLAFDARDASQALFRDDQFANLLLLGAAFQVGALPVEAASIEQAIELNGIAVSANVQAFRRGRQFVCDPNGFDKAVARSRVSNRREDDPSPRLGSPGDSAARAIPLEDLIAARKADLVAYQGPRYAIDYVDFVTLVSKLETQRLGGGDAIASAVAHFLHKLMAYKDEYEVARLSLDPSVVTAVEEQFGEGARVSYRLHPPLLRALGMSRKLEFGPWFKTVFRILRAGRHLRGTAFDPFGMAKVRRIERSLILEYRESIEAALTCLSPDNAHLVHQLAQLPDVVRGYEEVKLQNVVSFRSESSRLLAEIGA